MQFAIKIIIPVAVARVMAAIATALALKKPVARPERGKRDFVSELHQKAGDMPTHFSGNQPNKKKKEESPQNETTMQANQVYANQQDLST